MKKRSMLAIASLATGFVVAAVTPSHAVSGALGDLELDRTLTALDPHHTIADASLDGVEESALGKNG